MAKDISLAFLACTEKIKNGEYIGTLVIAHHERGDLVYKFIAKQPLSYSERQIDLRKDDMDIVASVLESFLDDFVSKRGLIKILSVIEALIFDNVKAVVRNEDAVYLDPKKEGNPQDWLSLNLLPAHQTNYRFEDEDAIAVINYLYDNWGE